MRSHAFQRRRTKSAKIMRPKGEKRRRIAWTTVFRHENVKLYALFKTEDPGNDTLTVGTSLYRKYMGVRTSIVPRRLSTCLPRSISSIYLKWLGPALPGHGGKSFEMPVVRATFFIQKQICNYTLENWLEITQIRYLQRVVRQGGDVELAAVNPDLFRWNCRAMNIPEIS